MISKKVLGVLLLLAPLGMLLAFLCFSIGVIPGITIFVGSVSLTALIVFCVAKGLSLIQDAMDED